MLGKQNSERATTAGNRTSGESAVKESEVDRELGITSQSVAALAELVDSLINRVDSVLISPSPAPAGVDHSEPLTPLGRRLRNITKAADEIAAKLHDTLERLEL